MSNAALTWAFKFHIKSGAKFVLVALADYADEEHSCYPSIAKLHDKTSIAEKTISVHLSALESAGFLTRERVRYSDGNLGNYRYKLNVDGAVSVAGTTLELKVSKPRGKAFEKQPHAKLADGEPHAKLGKTTRKIRQNHTLNLGDNNPHNNPQYNPHHQGGDDFDLFWEAYPRTDGQSQSKARGEWERLTQDQRDHALSSISQMSESLAKMNGGGYLPFVFLRDRIFESVDFKRPVRIEPPSSPNARKVFDAVADASGYNTFFGKAEFTGSVITIPSPTLSRLARDKYAAVLSQIGVTIAEAA